MIPSKHKFVSSLLAVALMTPVTLAHAADGTPLPPTGIRASIDRAVAAGAGAMVPFQASTNAPPVRLTRPDRSRKQMSGGGGKTMMVMGIVGTLAGIASTYYVVKMLKDNNDTAKADPQP